MPKLSHKKEANRMIKENTNYSIRTSNVTETGFADSIQIPDEGGVVQINKPNGEVIWLAPGTYDMFRMFPAERTEG